MKCSFKNKENKVNKVIAGDWHSVRKHFRDFLGNAEFPVVCIGAQPGRVPGVPEPPSHTSILHGVIF